MSPLNDKDLDRLSREAAEQYGAEPPASGWDALEKRLNKELPQKDDSDRRRLLFWLLFIVLLSGSGLWWLLRTHNTAMPMQDASKTLAEQSGAPSTRNTDQGPAAGNGSKDTAIPPSSQSSADNEQKPDISAVDPQSGAADPALQNTPANNGNRSKNPTLSNKPSGGITITEPQESIAAQQRSGLRPSAGLLNKRTSGRKPERTENILHLPVVAQGNSQKDKLVDQHKQRDQKQEEKTPVDTNNEPATTPVVTIPPNPTANIPPSTIDTTSKTIANNPTKLPATTKPPVETDSNAAIAKTKKPAARSGIQPLEIGLLAGPDLSNVKFSSAGKAGINLGLQVGYRFNQRWSVNTGIIYTKKYYEARGKDFTKPGWMQNYDLQSIEGNCSMLDIPVNVRYNLTTTKNRFFVSAGASTYLMDKEYYDYYFIYNGEYKEYPWKSDKNSNYVFSILNISGGWERPISRQFSLQVEPYLKLPFKGVGHGKLQLNSYGIYFSLKYAPVFKTKAKK